MKTIRTLIVMVALIMTLIPSAVFADADEELPKADNLEAEEAVEEETITAPEQETEQEVSDTETVPIEDPVAEPEPEEPVEEAEPSEPQHEDTELPKVSPFEAAAERLRAGGYADILDLQIKENESDALFEYIASSGIIEEGYELSILSEGGYISLLILSKEEMYEEKPAAKAVSEEPKVDRTISQEEQITAPTEDKEPVTELAAVEEAPKVPVPAPEPESEGEGNSVPLASFYGSLMLLIGAVKHIFF